MTHDSSARQLLRGTLDLLILQALSTRPLHGYAIARRVEVDTSDALSVEEGSLYPALHRLEERGLVTARWTTDRGRRVRLYALTRAGRKRLTERRQEWLLFARAVGRMIGGSR
jgi:transcriptional regulator